MKYYAIGNPVGEPINSLEFRRSIIEKIDIPCKKNYAIVRLMYPFPVGSIFHVVNRCENYYIKKRLKNAYLDYEVYKCDGDLTIEDLRWLKEKAIIFRDGFIHSNSNL